MTFINAMVTPAAPAGFFPGAQPAGTPVGAPARVVALGDSYIWDTWLSPNRTFRNSSPLAWAAMRVPLWYQTGDLLGVVGETTTQIFARIATALARPNIDIAIYNGGSNDFASGAIIDAATRDAAVATAQAQLRATIQQFYTANIPLALCTVPTRSTSTAFQIQATLAFNNWLRNVVAPIFAPRVVVADIASVAIDPATGLPVPNILRDGIHPGPNGARLMGDILAGAIAPWCSNRSDLAFADTDPANALAVGGLAPLFNAPGGTVSAPYTGQVPAGWNTYLSVGGFTSGAAVASLVPSSDGFGQWSQFALNAVVATGNDSVQIGLNSGSFTKPAFLATNDFFYLVFEGEADAGIRGLQSFTAFINESTGTSASITMSSDAVLGTELNLAGTTRFIMRTPALQILAGTTTILAQLYANVRGSIAGGVLGNVRFRRAAVRKVPANRSTT